jgi:hypothetical protein
MPRCRSTTCVERIVDSWPPCWLPVEVKTLPTLPTSLFAVQRLLVRSRKFLTWLAMFPNRVGVPTMIAP